jgi:hypothetical protein
MPHLVQDWLSPRAADNSTCGDVLACHIVYIAQRGLVLGWGSGIGHCCGAVEEVSEQFLLICLVVLNLAAGFAVAVPAARFLRSARPVRFGWCYTACLGIYLMECVASQHDSGILYGSGAWYADN